MKLSISAFTAAAALASFPGSATAFVSAPQHAASVGGTATALNLAVGEAAPDFELVDQNGKKVKRSSFKKPLVVYFYPADATPGCTVQATSFNSAVKDIRKEYGADVVGVSGQGVASKQKFAKELGLDFSILADEGTSCYSTERSTAVCFASPHSSHNPLTVRLFQQVTRSVRPSESQRLRSGCCPGVSRTSWIRLAFAKRSTTTLPMRFPTWRWRSLPLRN